MQNQESTFTVIPWEEVTLSNNYMFNKILPTAGFVDVSILSKFTRSCTS